MLWKRSHGVLSPCLYYYMLKLWNFGTVQRFYGTQNWRLNVGATAMNRLTCHSNQYDRNSIIYSKAHYQNVCVCTFRVFELYPMETMLDRFSTFLWRNWFGWNLSRAATHTQNKITFKKKENMKWISHIGWNRCTMHRHFGNQMTWHCMFVWLLDELDGEGGGRWETERAREKEKQNCAAQ